MGRTVCRLPATPFRVVNRRGRPGYLPGVQKHHVLPLQLLNTVAFERMFRGLGVARIDFDDFRHNGLLLPATSKRALIMGLPLHRGPHRRYNAMVIERVGVIEAAWSNSAASATSGLEAIWRLQLLQSALRRRLLAEKDRIVLNCKDPLGTGYDFTELDAMAETLWSATSPANA